MSLVKTIALIVFWGSAACLLYSYLLYPLIVWVAAKLAADQVRPDLPSETDLPRVSLLIAAFNEEAVIAARLRDALAIDYPRELLEIVIASDGSTDATARIVREEAVRSPQVRLIDYPVRSGKTSVLNRAIAELSGDIVVLSDANTATDSQAVKNLVRWFSRPDVGVVCGQLLLVDPKDGRNADSLYWRYENFLKTCEGRLGALLGANGGIYAIRRQLFRPVPPDTLVDDFFIPLAVKLRTGCRIVYEPGARAIEETPVDIQAEFTRRARIGAGGFQAIARLWPLLNPARGWLALSFFSHKVLRWFGPFFLMALLAANLVLLGDGLFRIMLAVQSLFYMLAAVGSRAPGTGPAARLARLPALFTGVNLALLAGFFRWLRGSQGGVWKRTTR
jgi:cellulose synthase/poly-beta-1,6-N-acetylglucosamine synthase-like glycosyltransferase